MTCEVLNHGISADIHHLSVLCICDATRIPSFNVCPPKCFLYAEEQPALLKY